MKGVEISDQDKTKTGFDQIFPRQMVIEHIVLHRNVPKPCLVPVLHRFSKVIRTSHAHCFGKLQRFDCVLHKI